MDYNLLNHRVQPASLWSILVVMPCQPWPSVNIAGMLPYKDVRPCSQSVAVQLINVNRPTNQPSGIGQNYEWTEVGHRFNDHRGRRRRRH